MPDNTVPAGNTGNLLMNMIYGQQNDPAQQMADWTRTQQARNRTAAGMDLSGNLLPAPAPGTPPGVGSGQITGPPQDPTAAMATLQQTGTLSPSQTPNAYKSDNTMGSMIISLQRRQEAAAGLQQSLGLAGAAISRPENRERVFKSFAPGPQGNPVELGQGLMNLASQTQGQDRMNAIGQMVYDPVRGPALATQLNIPWESLKARFQADPGGVGQMVQSFMQPTDAIRNLQAIDRMGGAVGGAPGTSLGDVGSQIIGGVAGQQAAPMLTAQQQWRIRNPGKPDSEMPWKANDLHSFGQYAANQDELNKSAAAAAETHGHNITSVVDMSNRIDDLKNNPVLDSLLREKGLKKTWAQNLVNDNSLTPTSVLARSLPAGVSFTEAELAVISDIRQLQGQNYANALHALGLSRPSEREIEGIKSGLGQTGNLSLSPEAYKEQGLDQTGEFVKSMIGNSFGASQNLRDIPERFRPYVDPQFLAGGTRNIEGSGSEPWANAIKPSAEEIAVAKAALKKGIPRWKVDMGMRSRGMMPIGY